MNKNHIKIKTKHEMTRQGMLLSSGHSKTLVSLLTVMLTYSQLLRHQFHKQEQVYSR